MKLFYVFIVLFIVLTSCTQVNKVKLEQTYSKDNYSIKYPKGWSLDTLKNMGTSFILFSPKEEKEDSFKENLNLMIQNLDANITSLNEYKRLSENQFKQIEGAKVIESKIIKGNAGENYFLKYNMIQNNRKLHFIAKCFVVNDKAYLATFTCEQTKIEKYNQVGTAMVNSFVLK